MSSISTCGAQAVLPSVPTVMVMPASAIFFKLRPWMLQVACTCGRSVAAACNLATSASGRLPLSQL